MNIIYPKLFPIFEFQCPTAIVDRLHENVAGAKFIKNHSLNSISTWIYDKDLFDWTNQCLKQVLVAIKANSIESVEVVKAWYTKTEKFQQHHYHIHKNSLFSCVLYLTDADTGTNLYFPDPWFTAESFLDMTTHNIKINNVVRQKFTTTAVKGKMIVFPSQILHSVDTNTGPTRYSIGMNCMPVGNIGQEDDTNNRLNITYNHIKHGAP